MRRRSAPPGRTPRSLRRPPRPQFAPLRPPEPVRGADLRRPAGRICQPAPAPLTFLSRALRFCGASCLETSECLRTHQDISEGIRASGCRRQWEKELADEAASSPRGCHGQAPPRSGGSYACLRPCLARWSGALPGERGSSWRPSFFLWRRTAARRIPHTNGSITSRLGTPCYVDPDRGSFTDPTGTTYARLRPLDTTTGPWCLRRSNAPRSPLRQCPRHPAAQRQRTRCRRQGTRRTTPNDRPFQCRRKTHGGHS